MSITINISGALKEVPPSGIDISELADQLNEFISSYEEGIQSPDCAEAEYCQSIGYGDSGHSIDLSNITDDEVQFELEGMSDEDRIACIKELGEVDFINSYLLQLNEVFSIHIGELEIDFPPELTNKIQALTPREFRELKDQVNCYLDSNYGLGYVYMEGCRWVLLFNASLDEVITWKRKRDRDRKRKNKNKE